MENADADGRGAKRKRRGVVGRTVPRPPGPARAAHGPRRSRDPGRAGRVGPAVRADRAGVGAVRAAARVGRSGRRSSPAARPGWTWTRSASTPAPPPPAGRRPSPSASSPSGHLRPDWWWPSPNPPSPGPPSGCPPSPASPSLSSWPTPPPSSRPSATTTPRPPPNAPTHRLRRPTLLHPLRRRRMLPPGGGLMWVHHGERGGHGGEGRGGGRGRKENGRWGISSVRDSCHVYAVCLPVPARWVGPRRCAGRVPVGGPGPGSTGRPSGSWPWDGRAPVHRSRGIDASRATGRRGDGAAGRRGGVGLHRQPAPAAAAPVGPPGPPAAAPRGALETPEEQLHLPPPAVGEGHRPGVQFGAVGRQHHALAALAALAPDGDPPHPLARVRQDRLRVPRVEHPGGRVAQAPRAGPLDPRRLPDPPPPGPAASRTRPSPVARCSDRSKSGSGL